MFCYSGSSGQSVTIREKAEMNPERIYTQYRDDALAKQANAKDYSIFVAMPFADQFSYRSKEIFARVIKAAAEEANNLEKTARPFREPKRADSDSTGALLITESILTEILYSHVFVGDLTFKNEGVLLESGIAMGLK